MVVHKGKDLSVPVLTNNSYDESVNAYKNSTANGNNSLERFETACNMIKQFTADKTDVPVTDYAFNILAEVAQGDFTKWSIVYDLTNKTIQFKTNRFKQIKSINFSSFDFNCTAPSKVWDMNQPQNGNVANLFQNFDEVINKRIVETAARESEDRVPISQQNRQRLWTYSGGIKCN